MSSETLATLVSVLAVSAVSLVALLALALRPAALRSLLGPLVSLAVGALYGDVFIHLLPEAFARPESARAAPGFALAGVAAAFAIERLLRRHGARREPVLRTVRPTAAVVLFASSIHNFLDGVLIATSYLSGAALGLSTTLAIVLHEIPHELGDFGILVAAGLSTRRAIAFNCASALVALLGAISGLALGEGLLPFSAYMVPFTAGNFLYLAGTDLLPELLVAEAAPVELLKYAGIALGVLGMALLRRS